jgi:2-dehydro-3-deoxyphosphogalactonate aldolase
MTSPLASYLAPLPLVAVLRGITPEEVPAIAAVLVDAGFRVLEVPLNSPRPFDSIRNLAEVVGEGCLVGAGTVVEVADVAAVRAAGGRLIVMPHSDRVVIAEATARGLACLPGVATPTEAFAALAGADGSRCSRPTSFARRARRVARGAPAQALLFPVGGIGPSRWRRYWTAGADGFGTGSHLYRRGARRPRPRRRACVCGGVARPAAAAPQPRSAETFRGAVASQVALCGKLAARAASARRSAMRWPRAAPS